MRYIFSIILIVFIILIYNYHIFIKEFTNLFNYKNIEDHKFKTGDIILTRCDYLFLYEPIHYLFFNIFNYVFSDVETHAATVVVLNGKSYVYNMCVKPYFDNYDGIYKWKSPSLIPLGQYLMCYTGDIFIYPTSNDFNEDKVVSFIEKTKNTQFSINMIKWLNTVIKLPMTVDNNHRICTHLVMEFLIFMGVVENSEINKMGFKIENATPTDIKDVIFEKNEHFGTPFMLNNCYNQVINGKK